MVNIDKIRELAKEKGIKQKYITDKLGVPHTYFADIKNKNRDIPDCRLSIIADTLDTTIEYLRDETDIKEKAPDQDDQVQDKNILRIAGRDGTYIERKLTDEQMRAFRLMVEQLPEADDL